MSTASADPFTPDVVAQIAHHMNSDHAADNVLIVRAFGGHPAATSAVMSGLDATGIEFEIDGGAIARVPFGTTLTARPQVRGEVTRLFHEAQAVLGIKPAFSVQLRDATADLHDKATRVPYLGELMRGKLDAVAYAEMVAQHWYAYRELEAIVVANPGDPIVQAFHLPPLTRLPKIEDDLASLLGPQWQDLITPNEATLRYTARIREVCTDWPGGFVAHHYTRYLGDLSGGQFIRKVVDRTIGAGTSFYDFSDLGDLAAFKEDYRHLLDATTWDDAERERIVVESRIAYELNIEVLEQLTTR
ncbi:biliverdin-producing heme oxygenase [Allocatelliglobosispora scoriae]|nr:biliverdin-producing heme oxygenase [Allocatelliglobosispora scoriae]